MGHLTFYLSLPTGDVSALYMCVHTLQHVVCVPLCVCGSAPVCRVIYWKALQWYQNSFALNACSECLLLPVCFMDHDHTLFVSRFYISKDYFLWLLIFIRAESVSKKARRERWGIVGLVVTMIYQSWRELVLFMSEIVSSALWQEWINNSPIEQGFPATKGGWCYYHLCTALCFWYLSFLEMSNIFMTHLKANHYLSTLKMFRKLILCT